MSPDVVFDQSRSVGPAPDIYRGREEITKFLWSWWDAFDESIFHVDELIDAGDRVVAVGQARTLGRGSGAAVRGRGAAYLWSFRDGKAISSVLFQTPAEAVAAAGLTE